jgi:hypothetical protein
MRQIVLLLLPLTCLAQTKSIFPLKDGKVYYEKIIQVDSVDQSLLHNRAKAWALSYFRSQKDALQTEDKESGILVYKGFYTLAFKGAKIKNIETIYEWKVWSTYTILTKDGKAKIINTDVLIDAEGYGAKPAEIFLSSWERDMTEATKQIKYMKKSITKTMEESKGIMIENLERVDATNRRTIEQIENYLSGKTKSDLEF